MTDIRSTSESRRVGFFEPRRTTSLSTAGPDPELVAQLRGVTGLSSAFSDELDRLGVRTAVPASSLHPLDPGAVSIGRVITLRYIASRYVDGQPRLAHGTAWQNGQRGDLLVIQAPDATSSVLGGEAAEAAVAAGLAGVVVDGAVRDLDEIATSGLAVWSRGQTPMTGRTRLEAVEINGPIQIDEVGVEAGDTVIADSSGVVFVPAELFAALAARILAAAPRRSMTPSPGTEAP